MKYFFLFFICFQCNHFHAQPSWVLDHFESQIGVWSADNSEYKSDTEPMTVYILEWNWSGIKNSLVGRLYGKIDSISTPIFWDFYQYWNPKIEQIEIKQIGSDGTLGVGSMTFKNSLEYDLNQEFTTPNGNSKFVRHDYKKQDSDTEITTSFDETVDGKWVKKRTYFWFKIK